MNVSKTIPDDADRTELAGSPRYRRYLILMLAVSVALNYCDRQILGILMPPIKAELGLSDTQLGLLSGLSFGLFYAAFGLPLARWADVGNRRWLLTLSLLLWSGMTALCGMAQGFWSLFAARLGVGIGEAGGTPTAHSLLADAVAAPRRGAAAGLLAFASVVGSFGGIIAAGAIAEHYGWRAAFFCAGAAGLPVAALLLFTVREQRTDTRVPGLAEAFGSDTWRTVRSLLADAEYRHLALGMMASLFWQWGTGAWVATYLVRSRGLTLSEVALTFGTIGGAAAAIGGIAGGLLNDRLSRGGRHWRATMSAVCTALAFVPATITFLATETTTVYVALFASTLLCGMTFPAVYAGFYQAAGSSRRATAVALSSFLNNIVGLSLGPLLIGLASDALSRRAAAVPGRPRARPRAGAPWCPARSLLANSGSKTSLTGRTRIASVPRGAPRPEMRRRDLG